MHLDWFDSAHHKYAQCKQKGFVQFIVLGIVVLAVVATGVFYLGKQAAAPKSQPQNQVATVSATPSSIPTASPAPTGVDETVEWKVLKKNGWEIKYPPNWYVQGEENQRSNSILNKVDLQKSEIDIVLQGDFPGESPSNFDGFFAREVGSVVKDGFRTVTTVKKLNIDGYPAVEILDEDSTPLVNETTRYSLGVYVKGPLNISISALSPLYGVDKSAHERFLTTYTPIFEKMLTTVKFSK